MCVWLCLFVWCIMCLLSCLRLHLPYVAVCRKKCGQIWVKLNVLTLPQVLLVDISGDCVERLQGL